MDTTSDPPNMGYSHDTLPTACTQILQAPSQSKPFDPLPSHDLQALVRTMYLYRYEVGRRKVQDIRQHENSIAIGQLKEFWDEALAVAPWDDFDRLAKDCNFSELTAKLGPFVQELP